MNTRIRGGRLSTVLAGLALVLAACAPAAQPSPTAAPAKPAATTAPAKPAEKPAAKEAQKPAAEKPAAQKPAAKTETKTEPKPAAKAEATGPAVEIRLGHGFAAEEQLWLMAAMPEITPNQGKAYTLKFTAFRANADRLSAYEAGQIDGGTMPAPTGLFAAEQGVPFKLVASIVRESNDPNWHNSTYLALEESGIKSAQDARGKTIGIVDFKSATELWARAAVESAGLNPNSDVKYVVVPFPAMGESLRSKKIDIGVFVNPFYALEKQKGGVVDVWNAKTGVPFDEELLMIFLRPDFVSQNQAAVKAFLSDFVAATKFYLGNTKQARQALIDKKFVQTPPEIYLEMKDWYREPSAQITKDGLSKLQELHLKLGWQNKQVNIDELVDTSMLPSS